MYKFDKSKTVEFNPNSDLMATRVRQTILAFNRSKSSTVIDPPIKSIMLAAKELVKPDGQKLTNFFSKKTTTDVEPTELSSPKKSSPAKTGQLKSPTKKLSPVKKATSPIKKAFENVKASKKRKSSEFERKEEIESDSDGDSDENQPKRTKLNYPHVEPFDFSLISEVGEDEEFETYLKLKCLECPHCHKSIELINFKNHAFEHGFEYSSE